MNAQLQDILSLVLKSRAKKLLTALNTAYKTSNKLPLALAKTTLNKDVEWCALERTLVTNQHQHQRASIKLADSSFARLLVGWSSAKKQLQCQFTFVVFDSTVVDYRKTFDIDLASSVEYSRLLDRLRRDLDAQFKAGVKAKTPLYMFTTRMRSI